MRLLDLYCGAGGSAMGYHRAGFDVVGVDIRPMPRFPFTSVHGDALEYALEHGDSFDVIHASPPCQGYSRTSRFGSYVWPQLIGPTRDVLTWLGVPYVIENVRGAPLRLDASIELCGCMFPGQMFTYRPRVFETSFPAAGPPHEPHVAPNAPMGRRPRGGEFMHVVGNPTGADESRRAMGVSWMQRRELCEAVPPCYTTYVGQWAMRYLGAVAA